MPPGGCVRTVERTPQLLRRDPDMDYGYGLWPLVIIISAIFIVFALSFFRPGNSRDWKAMGGFTAFIVALFTEMYGFPLTVYLLTGALGSRFESLNLTHEGGHLWSELIGWHGDPQKSEERRVGTECVGTLNLRW